MTTAARHNLPADLPDAARAYLDALPPGVFEGFDIASLDRTGVPVWVVALFLDERLGLTGAQPSGIGYGDSDGDGILGALGEIAEAIAPSLAMMNRPRVSASYADLARVHGARAVADPLELGLPAGADVGHGTVLDWTEATRFATGETVLVPLDIAACDHFELAPGYRPFTTLITNGLGAGPDLAWAVGHGVLELLQRDGNGLLFRALDRGVGIDLPADLPGPAGRLTAMFRAQGIRAIPKFATDEFGLTNLYVTGHDEPGRGPAIPIMLSACGEACDPSPSRALAKAMREFAAARVRKAFSHGPLDKVAGVAPVGYVERFVARALPSLQQEESRALRAMLDWATLPAERLQTTLAPVYAVNERKDFATLPDTPYEPRDSRAAGAVAIDRLQAAGFDVLFVDCSPPGRPYAAVKAIVPRLEVETMSYHRIGERNTLKLLARDHPLIAFDFGPGRAPVRLNDAARARVHALTGGRDPLFDTALCDRIVGGLYPLYREPEAHHVAYRLGQVRAAA